MANTELEMLPAYSPFLNIVEQAISSLKTTIKGDVSRPEIQARMDDRDHAKEYSFNVIELTIRANETCFEEFECRKALMKVLKLN